MTLSTNSYTSSAKSRLLVSPEYDDVTTSWFSPEFWNERAKPVSTGGRGGAWFIDSEPADMVLRHYRRGGLMARMAERSYLFTGFEATRSLAEFRLIKQLYALDLPVPDAVAAIAWKYRLFWYRAAILVKRIPGAVTLPDCKGVNDVALWKELGRVIRRFHDAGVNHVDLNCDNVLVARNQVYLIDFDRCKIVASSDNSRDAPWKVQNLKRFQRSVVKRCLSISPVERERLWDQMLLAYRSPVLLNQHVNVHHAID